MSSPIPTIEHNGKTYFSIDQEQEADIRVVCKSRVRAMRWASKFMQERLGREWSVTVNPDKDIVSDGWYHTITVHAEREL